MWQLILAYVDSGKRYLIPFEIVEKYVDSETIDRIKIEAMKEIQKQ